MDSLTQGNPTLLYQAEILLRMLLATGFGAIIGLERERRSRPAGLRTHMLTALASCVFTIVALELFRGIASADATVAADPVRAIQAVTAGAAFLAAGAIIHGQGRVVGLTTGASMWLAGAIGLACGGGYYMIAAFATLLAIVILALLVRIEKRKTRREDAGDDE